ncbi:c-type cytochrome biogenesis protein CcmI [Arenibacterium halophilum]|uniref:C-type cytochrome biogenesis protein CcmI n=1 Tax=Arenibacterium halophilum TaxID=2583821 RepID=A0ABY2XBX5_9RHOB|nr:c-type cytochrome biogenesis protein CcmI [Arenibacterium halophilum]TMV13252.1 c-type cytochrome biogenesis protein CcmI [Arenibacterium halophilum]
MVFWIIPALVALAVAGLIARVMTASRDAGDTTASHDMSVYRDQLAEIERDRARGTIPESEAEQLRTEVARRILAADSAARDATSVSAPAGKAPALALGAVLVVGSLGLYAWLGVPGYGDMGLQTRYAMAERLRTERPTQSDAEAQTPAQSPAQDPGPEYLALVAQLRETVAQRPDDLQGNQLLARHESALGNFVAAHAAQARVIDIKGDGAGAGDYASYADLLILAAGGYVSPTAEQALKDTLARDPRSGPAQYYMGLLEAQNARPDRAFRIWNRLLQASPPDAPWVPAIRSQIADAARLAGVDYALPAQASGPTAEDVANAAELDDAGRQEMIQGMVEGLAARLAEEGGPAPEWARLIAALGVLGEVDRARAIADEARNRFAGDSAALEQIEQAAQRAGIAE